MKYANRKAIIDDFILYNYDFLCFVGNCDRFEQDYQFARDDLVSLEQAMCALDIKQNSETWLAIINKAVEFGYLK